MKSTKLVATITLTLLTAACAISPNDAVSKAAQQSCIKAIEEITADPNSLKIDGFQNELDDENMKTFIVNATVANSSGGSEQTTYECTTTTTATSGSWNGVAHQK